MQGLLVAVYPVESNPRELSILCNLLPEVGIMHPLTRDNCILTCISWRVVLFWFKWKHASCTSILLHVWLKSICGLIGCGPIVFVLENACYLIWKLCNHLFLCTRNIMRVVLCPYAWPSSYTFNVLMPTWVRERDSPSGSVIIINSDSAPQWIWGKESRNFWKLLCCPTPGCG